MRKCVPALFLFLAFASAALAQSADTLMLMHYNLLNYGNFTSFCTNNNNSLTDKDGDLETVTKFVKPDIFTANEIGASPIYLLRILNNSLNTQGVSYYSAAAYTNTANSDLVNGFFYNSQKLGLLSQAVITTASTVRDINLYRLYHKSANLATTGDTAFLNVIVAHLKAGSSSGDAATRATETAQVMAYLNALPATGNYVIAGDFNVYTSSEVAFQNLISPTSTQRFYDPINQLGSWSNNSSFAPVHTQSTSTTSGCKASGGMDDRFDFILANDHVMGDSARVKYVPGSYKAIGQDGMRFNQSILNPSNPTVSFTLGIALARMSDHLPVTMKVVVSSSVTALADRFELTSEVFRVQTFFHDRISIWCAAEVGGLQVTVYSLDGRLVMESHIGTGQQGLDVAQLAKGAYIIHAISDSGKVAVKRAVKN